MTPKCPYCGGSNSKKLPMSNKSAILLWVVGLPIVCILAGAVGKLFGDFDTVVGGIIVLTGLFALLKFFAIPASCFWKCPDCHQKFNFVSQN